jgi:hypothetical protein
MKTFLLSAMGELQSRLLKSKTSGSIVQGEKVANPSKEVNNGNPVSENPAG